MNAAPPMPDYAARFLAQREAFAADCNPSVAVRRERLDRLLGLIDGAEDALIAAVDADFGGRAAQETRIAEIYVTRRAIVHARRHLASWMRTRRAPTDLAFLPGRNRLTPQPLGVVGVVSPWNYPIQLSLCPLVGALAAGNRALLKPSELTPRTSALLAELIGKAFAPDLLDVVVGDAEIGKAFVALPFDHLLFTGSTAVGRQVAAAAATNLTPVTLELGGKSPAIFDPSCDFAAASARLAAGKLFNAGQTCIAPDYLLVPRGRADAAAEAIAAAIGRLYPTLAANPDYTAIVSDRHRARLVGLINEARDAGTRIVEVNPARESFEGSRKLPPTLAINPPPSTKLMREEIFGPALPIIEYDQLDDAIAHVNRGQRPLALYWFGRDSAARDRVLRETISGGVTVNDTLFHYAAEDLPFGGVGASGYGAYHGEQGFLTFTKEKAVFFQTRFNLANLLYPPYGKKTEAVLAGLRRIA